jgi:hypothetical protein
VVSEHYSNLSVENAATWSYTKCPDVNECRLGLYSCHPNASCINTFDGYDCRCNQGFLGDGMESCEET